MEARTLRAAPYRVQNSDEEDERDFSTHFYQHPVPTSVVTTDHDLPRKRTQQVTGSIIPRNISSADLLPSPDHSDSAEYYVSQKDITEPNYGDSKSKSSNAKTFQDRITHREPTESSALLQPQKTVRKARPKRVCIFCFLTTALVVLLLATVTISIVYVFLPLSNTESVSIVQNENDTVIAVQVNTETTKKLSLKLLLEQAQPLHVVNIYSTLCNRLRIHSSVEYSSAKLSIDGALLILSPTYLASGSTIHISSYVLNASVITARMELYVFCGLSELKNFAANLPDAIYKATIYTSGSVAKNTSTFIDYTAPTTDYYFLAVDSTATVYAQFDITVNQKYYDPADYAKSCVLQDSSVCDLSYHTSFEDKQQCVLAHVMYVPDTQWIPAYIQVTEEHRRSIKTTVILLPSLAGINIIFIFGLIFCLLCLYKKSRRKT